MILGFYYHYAVYQADGKNYLPGFLGCFVDSLATEVERLLLICHCTTYNDNNLYDYALQATNIEVVPIAPRSAAWHRHLFHQRILKPAKDKLVQADFLIVRSPTPLAPFFNKIVPQHKLVYLVVGDYEESVKQMPTRNLRDWIMKKYVMRNDALFRKEMKRTAILVNAPSLYEKYHSQAKRIETIKTTTLSSKSFFERNALFPNNEIKLLYTGRIDAAKGLFELIEALYQLRNKHNARTFSLHVVGWEDQPSKPVENALRRKAENLGVLQHVYFHGKKRIGDELNTFYRMADIYVIPSYHEGFPRTIWEAMANGLPVIATTVGAIPQYLKTKQDALLIEPKNSEAITNAVFELINQQLLAQQLVENGYRLAKENTLEIQTKKMISILHQWKQSDVFSN